MRAATAMADAMGNMMTAKAAAMVKATTTAKVAATEGTEKAVAIKENDG